MLIKPISVLLSGAKKTWRFLLAVILDIAIIPVVLGYYQTLKFKAWGKWHSLPEEVLKAIQPFFDIDLSLIRYAENKRTGKRVAITFGNHLFFPSKINLKKESDLKWLLHEITHSEQYKHAGGLVPFLHKYIFDITSNLFRAKKFRVHDVLAFEKASDAHVRNIIILVMNKLNNLS